MTDTERAEMQQMIAALLPKPQDAQPSALTGKDVPALWQAGNVEACLLKNYYDLLLTQHVFNHLSTA
jgi:hypothetical protein